MNMCRVRSEGRSRGEKTVLDADRAESALKKRSIESATVGMVPYTVRWYTLNDTERGKIISAVFCWPILSTKIVKSVVKRYARKILNLLHGNGFVSKVT